MDGGLVVEDPRLDGLELSRRLTGRDDPGETSGGRGSRVAGLDGGTIAFDTLLCIL
jgi:hypothetical protein